MGFAMIFAMLGLAAATPGWVPQSSFGAIGVGAVLMTVGLAVLLLLRHSRAVYRVFVIVGGISAVATTWVLWRYTWGGTGLLVGITCLGCGLWNVIGGMVLLSRTPATLHN